MNRQSKTAWTVAIFIFVSFESVGFQLRGSLLPAIQSTYSTSTELLGLVATAGTLGFVAAVLVTGAIAGRLDIRLTMIISVGLVGLSIFAVGIAPSFGILLAALFIRGIATAPFRALDRAVLGHFYPESRAQVFNGYAVVWAVGATTGPLIAYLATQFGNWRFAYLALSVAFIPAVGLLLYLDVPDSLAAEKPLNRDSLRVLGSDPAVKAMIVGLIFSGGVEGSLFTWLPYFATTRAGFDDGFLLLMVYLAAYIPARYTYSRVLGSFNPQIMIIVLASLALPLAIALPLAESKIGLYVVACLLGACVSGLFPTLSAIGVDSVPAYSSPINSLAAAAGFIGISTFPPIVGMLTAQADIARAFYLLPVLLAGYLIVAGFLYRT